jgi:hypothetical protein
VPPGKQSSDKGQLSACDLGVLKRAKTKKDVLRLGGHNVASIWDEGGQGRACKNSARTMVLKRTVSILPIMEKQGPSTLSEGGTWPSCMFMWLQWNYISITSLIGWFIQLGMVQRICGCCG